jgi:tRNA modification GTPase
MKPSIIDQTLAVPVTPPGRGAVAIIQVSGTEAPDVVRRLLEAGDPPPPGRARHSWLVDDRGERLDDALIVSEDPSHSLTGLPLVELGIHGGPMVMDAVMAALEAAGALPGEWRNLLEQAGRTGAQDPLRLAAHRRLPRTVSRRGVAILMQALSGDLHECVRGALVEEKAEAATALVEASREARQWFRPLRVVLTGPANAGKSTLFNALLGWERATVSGEAGTTRDAVEEELLVDDRPVRLVDTAGGLEETALVALARRATVVVHLTDASEPGPWTEPHPGIDRRRLVRVANKIDRVGESALDRFPAPWVRVSARRSIGLDDLLDAVSLAAGAGWRSRGGPGSAHPALFTTKDVRLLESALGPPTPGARAARSALLARARLVPGAPLEGLPGPAGRE